MRIDVQRDPANLQAELDAIERRLHRKGDALNGLPTLDIRRPGFVFRHREADGEHYVYVEDAPRGRLAGYTVFNRLVEVDRRADRHLRAPHSRYAPDYQRCGLATAVYDWWLAAGRSLITGARQSPAANALWHSLAKRHELFYVRLEDKRLRCLGEEVDEVTRGDLHTRMILVGSGLDRTGLAALIGCQQEVARLQ
ncbi:N-acetyltransferase [Zeimonas arvi]|uniref:N-acetyltransferase n=1 Tax=Zeimonas arvi TaxID=2498847 RepID=A0A5C8P5M0_9BURK|nr:N-acetyltransferase [Zeimonas arvi]